MTFSTIILAAGQGTRMHSRRHKVLHAIAGKPMLLHLLDTVGAMGAERRVVVVGKGREQVEAAVAGGDVATAVQAEQLGTGHAVRQAENALDGFDGKILVLYGDVPFVSAVTLQAMLDRLDGDDRPGVVVLASSPPDPQAYGRVLVEDSDRIAKMVEYKDATETERAVPLCNSGMLAAHSADLFRWLGQVGNANAAGEYYLPDVVMIAAAEGRTAVVVEADSDETAGVNSRAELAELERDWQRRRRAQALADGVTLIDPDSVFFAFDTEVAADVTIEPNVIFGPGVRVGEGATIRAFSHIEGATIGAGSEIGPFARLRPGADLGIKVKIGNFVEIKKARVADGAKVNHLSYIGDADIGRHANIGAGTITCNYDGFGKHHTSIGAGAFIGSNTALVAPVRIGEGAIVGAGSVVTKDVDAAALAVARAEQVGHSGWAARFRARQDAKKADPSSR